MSRPSHHPAANVKAAPLFLQPATIAKIVDSAERPGNRVVCVPILPVKLVDRPRRSQDPRLARANDDPPVADDLGAEPPVPA